MNDKVSAAMVLAAYAQDTGAFRVTNKAATELAEACAAFAELLEANEQLDEANRRIRLDRDSHVEWMSEELSPLRSLRYGELELAEQRRAAALARVKGE